MRRIIIVIILLLSFINVYSSTSYKTNTTNDISENQYDKLLDLAKTYVNKNTEYAFNCAYKAHAIAEQNHDNEKLAECNMIMGNIFKDNSSFPTAISYYEKAIENLIAIKKYHTIYKLYLDIAKLYQNSEFENKWSLDAMNKAMKYAEIINETAIFNDLYLSYGDLYASQGEYNLAINYYDKILKNNINKNTIHSISIALTKKANIFIYQKTYENALSMIDSSLYLCIRDFNDSLQIVNYNYKAKIYDSINDFESAKKYYHQSATLAYSIKDFNSCGNSMFNLANLYQKHNEYDNAINVFKIICDSTMKYHMFEIYYQSCYQLSKCYASLGQYKKAYSYLDLYDAYQDSALVINQDKKIEELRNSYLLSLNIKDLTSKKIEEEKLRNNKNELKLFIRICIVLILILITFIILYSKNKTILQKNEVTSYEQQHKIDQIENDLMEYKLKENKELIMKLAMKLKTYTDIIEPIRDELKLTIELPENEQKNRIKNIYHNIQNNINILNSTENISKQINTIYKDFLDKLEEKHPSLTKAEKKLCAMLYINMSSKEIAAITNTTIRTVETSRYRLRRKFELTRDEDIVNFLQKM